MLASVSGLVVYDWAGDGIERDFSGWPENPDFGLRDLRVYVDEDGSGTYTDGEPHDITDIDGKYSIDGLGAGTHTVALELDAPWQQVFPAGGTDHSVTVGASDDATEIDFGALRPTRVPFTPGNLLVSRPSSVLDDLLLEYQPDGTLVQAIQIPAPDDHGSIIPKDQIIPKDLVVDRLGQVQIFNHDGRSIGNGNYVPHRLMTFDPVAGSFVETSVPNWAIGGANRTWGDIATIGDYVFVNEHIFVNSIAGDVGEADGVIRFNITNQSYERFSTGFGVPQSLTIGRDGLLYTMESTVTPDNTIGYSVVRVHDPLTMQPIRDFRIQDTVNEIAVDENSNVYALTDTGLKHFDQNGNLVKGTIQAGGVAHDFYLSNDGTLWIANQHHVQSINTDFEAASITEFDIHGRWSSIWAGYVTVVEPHTPVAPAVGTSSISGYKWHDLDGDGFREDGDQGLAGWTIFLDQGIQNGFLDPGEPFTVTDADGYYEFSDVPSGLHTIAEMSPPGWSPTYPLGDFRQVVQANVGQPAVTIDFGNKKDNVPLTEGNILVSWSTFQQNDLLVEYTPVGEVVQSWPIPGSESFSNVLIKDVVVDSLGKVQIFNNDGQRIAPGVYQSHRLMTVDPAPPSFVETNVPDWQIGTTIGSWGDIAAFGDFVFVNEHENVNIIAGDVGAADGLIRFNVNDLSWERFSDNMGVIIDFTVGRNGLLYTFQDTAPTTTVNVYNPMTMELVRTFTIDDEVKSAAVDAAGNIYGLALGFKQFDANGQLVNSIAEVGGSKDDVYLSRDGKLVLAGKLEVETIDTDFDPASIVRFDIPGDARDTANGYATVVEPPVDEIPAPGFIVTQLEPTSSGFTARFNREFDPTVMNLYDVQSAVFGAADATLVGQTAGAVSGTLLLGTDSITFVAAGGPLPADTYTVALRSADNGFRDTASELLDGNQDGIAGDNYVGGFTVDAQPGRVVSLPDFVRGPNQPVDVPATGDFGLPVSVSDASDITELEVTINFDPGLLNISAAVPGPGLPAGSMATFSELAPGQVSVSFSSPASLPAGPADLFSLTADVPGDATYGASHGLFLSDVEVNGGAIPASADDAVHLAAYFGDTTGNRAYSGLDAQRIARVAVKLDGGFGDFPTIDPIMLGDITGNGELTGLDAQRVGRESVGLDPPEIPPLPDQVRAANGGQPARQTTSSQSTAGNTIQIEVESTGYSGAIDLPPLGITEPIISAATSRLSDIRDGTIADRLAGLARELNQVLDGDYGDARLTIDVAANGSSREIALSIDAEFSSQIVDKVLAVFGGSFRGFS